MWCKKLVLFSTLILLIGCSDDPNGETTSDAGDHEVGLGDGGEKGDAIAVDADDTADAAPLTRSEWANIDTCALDEVTGPVVVFAESEAPQGCVRVFFEQSEEQGAYDIEVDSGWRAVSARVARGSCAEQLEDIDQGVRATKGVGSVDLGLSPLGMPEELVEAQLGLTFPADNDNPFDALEARVEVASDQSIAITRCN